MSRRNLTLLICAMVIGVLCRTRAGYAPQSRVVADAYDAIDLMAYERPGRQELLQGALDGMVQVLKNRGDEHSQYIDPKRAQRFMDVMRQELRGIGVRLRKLTEPERLLVTPLSPDTPAAAAGIRPNDQVLKIDGAEIAGMEIQEVVDLMTGAVDESVVLTVLHEGESDPVEIRVVRAVINLPSVIGDKRLPDGSWRFLLDGAPGVAYIRLTNFGNNTVDELAELLPRLTSKGAKAIVLDVRDNPGGTLDTAIGVSDLFLAKGAAIVEIRDRKANVRDAYHASGNGAFLKQPMVVLVNEDSASASEIVAACLQDNGRARVAGQRSYGKGTVQRIIPLQASRSYLKLTTSTYWRPSDKNIHKSPDDTPADDWGVRPDVDLKVELTKDEHLVFSYWRAGRDLTPFDPETGEPLTSPPVLSDEVTVPEDFRDKCLERAVEYLQEELGQL